VLAVLELEAKSGLSSRLIARRLAWLLGVAAPLLSADGTLRALHALHALIGAADGAADVAVRLTAVAALKRFVRRSGAAAPLPAGVAESFAGTAASHRPRRAPRRICARGRGRSGFPSPAPRLRRDWARPSHLCTGTGPTLPHLHRD
jgi:hypothetical protein